MGEDGCIALIHIWNAIWFRYFSFDVAISDIADLDLAIGRCVMCRSIGMGPYLTAA